MLLHESIYMDLHAFPTFSLLLCAQLQGVQTANFGENNPQGHLIQTKK